MNLNRIVRNLNPSRIFSPQNAASSLASAGNDSSQGKAAQKLKLLEKGRKAQGTLLIRAMPWAKISIGETRDSERPVLKKLPFGNYKVKATYRTADGQWHSIHKSVSVQKPSTVCEVEFQQGQGRIRCK